MRLEDTIHGLGVVANCACCYYFFQEKDEKVDGDAAFNKIFHDIYKNVDEDTRMAISFCLECRKTKADTWSNGKSLLTCWNDGSSHVLFPQLIHSDGT